MNQSSLRAEVRKAAGRQVQTDPRAKRHRKAKQRTHTRTHTQTRASALGQLQPGSDNRVGRKGRREGSCQRDRGIQAGRWPALLLLPLPSQCFVLHWPAGSHSSMARLRLEKLPGLKLRLSVQDCKPCKAFNPKRPGIVPLGRRSHVIIADLKSGAKMQLATLTTACSSSSSLWVPSEKTRAFCQQLTWGQSQQELTAPFILLLGWGKFIPCLQGVRWKGKCSIFRYRILLHQVHLISKKQTLAKGTYLRVMRDDLFHILLVQLVAWLAWI